MGKQAKNILFVDDETVFLKSISDGLKPHLDPIPCRIHTAQNGKEAMAILTSTPMDAVFTDIRMPKADGFKLITYIINNHPGLPIVVLTAFGSLEIEKQVKSQGAIHYLEKPIDFEVLLHTVFEVLEAENKEDWIDGITVASLLQLMAAEAITATLSVTADKKSGSLYVKNGSLIEAEFQGKKGLPSALELLSWKKAKITMKKVCQIKKGTISRPLTAILWESFHQGDASRLEAGPPVVDKESLNRLLDKLKNSLADSLIASEIYHLPTRQTLNSWNCGISMGAKFGEFSQSISQQLPKFDFPPLNRYILFHLSGDQYLLILSLCDYLWCIRADGHRVQLGYLLNLAIPQAIKDFSGAFKREN